MMNINRKINNYNKNVKINSNNFKKNMKNLYRIIKV